MSEIIKDVDIVKQHEEDLTKYSIYIARKRVVPDYRDGLKPVHRNIIYAMYKDGKAFPKNMGGRGPVKTKSVVGNTIAYYSPTGDSGAADAIKPMTNWFEIKQPLIDGHVGSFGDPGGMRMADPRYTEIQLTQYTMDAIIADMKQTEYASDWEPNYTDSLMQPIYFPAAVPNLLINGSFGIAAGLSVDIPKHNLNEVIDATIKLLHNPKAKFTLIPDNCMETEIIDTDWKKINETGRGNYIVRAMVRECELTNERYKHVPALHVTSVPDLVFFDSIKEKIEKLVQEGKLPQVIEIVDMSKDDDNNRANLDVYIVLKKGSDPNYVKNFLFNNTYLEKPRRVNLEVLIKDEPVLLNYRQYLLAFIEFRKGVKYRLYANEMQKIKTRYHKMELYVKAFEKRGLIQSIQKMIFNRTDVDESKYIHMLNKELNVTDGQSKYLLHTDAMKFSKGYYEKAKAELIELTKQAAHCYDMLSCDDLIVKEIESELIEYKKRYGAPRMSHIISRDEASNIPSGIFKIVITTNNYIKKMEVVHDITGSLGGQEELCSFPADNKDNLIIFGRLGKVFKLPVSKIPFGAKGTPGIDIRKILKNLTSDICDVIPESNLRKFAESKKNFVYVLTQNGYMKRLDCNDIMNVSPSGYLFTKLDSDLVQSILFMPETYQFIVFSHNKALKLKGTDAPYLRRSTKGVFAMKTPNSMCGMSIVYPHSQMIVAVTRHGYVNKIPFNALPDGKRAKAGSTVMKLSKTDKLSNILSCKDTESIVIKTTDGKETIISVKDIPLSSSLSTGQKIVNNESVGSYIQRN